MPDTTFWAWVAGAFGLGWACNSLYQSRTAANGSAQQKGYRTGAAAASDASIDSKARAQSDAFPAIVDNKGPMKLVRSCARRVLLHVLPASLCARGVATRPPSCLSRCPLKLSCRLAPSTAFFINALFPTTPPHFPTSYSYPHTYSLPCEGHVLPSGPQHEEG